ncbi:MAG: fimbria/pilus outer membrane usher protein [Gallionellaceae bacterium]
MNFLLELLKCVSLLLIGCLICQYQAVASDNGTTIPTLSQALEGDGPKFAEQTNSAATEFQEWLLLVDINRQHLNQTVLVLEDKGGMLYLSSRNLLGWRLKLPDTSLSIDYQGEKYYPLSAIHDVSHVFDPKKLTLMIEMRPEAFAETARDMSNTPIPPPATQSNGGFVNYDLYSAHSSDATQNTGQFELGYFNSFGVGTTNLLANYLGSNPGVTRLDTTWTVDYPEKMQTLRLGDAISTPGSWGRSVRFGGIQYGTDFSTQPGFITLPLQNAVGQAVLPSTVDVLINNALVSRQDVPPGPFSISNVPVVTGAGEVQLVVRDLLGREQLITQPFYSSASLLREGLEDFSYEFGFVRQNFGINSNDYGSWLGTGTYRRGMSERFTGEVHAEALSGQVTLGVGGDYLIPIVGTISSYIAGSHSSSNNGILALLGVDREALPWSFNARTQWTTAGFTEVGLTPQQLEPIQLSSFAASYASGSAGSVGIAYVIQQNRGQADARIATLSYSTSLGRIGSFNISAARSLVGDVNTTIFALLSIPLSPSTSVSFSQQSVRGSNSGNSDDFTATLQRNLPMGEGYGYKLLSQTDGYKEASYSLQNNIGTYSVGAADSLGSTATRLEVSGGVALFAGDAFLSRHIDQSFAVVRIPDYPNVHILADNQPAGQTDSNGNALIPQLRAYDRNVISIDQRDVPLDAEIGTLKIDAIPNYRSGVDVKFPIRHSRGATLTIQLEDGSPLPVGASVHIVGEEEHFTVGYNGEAYVVGLSQTNRLSATWRGQSCEFDVPYTASTDPLPDLGTFICKGVKQ